MVSLFEGDILEEDIGRETLDGVDVGEKASIQ
jgi:hypothetical protein